MAAVNLSDALPVKVILRRDDGSGIVEIPILPETTDNDRISVTRADLEKIAANFGEYPGPVPIGVSPHVEFDERAGFSPGFVEKLTVRGSNPARLYAQIDLIGPLFYEVVEARGWRGFSVEMHKNLKHPDRKFEGWVLTGGVFTNRPATDTHFKVAAMADVESDVQVAASFTLRPTAEEETAMAEETKTTSPAAPAEPKVEKTPAPAPPTEKTVSLAFHQARESELKGNVTALEAELRTANSQLEAANRELHQSRIDLQAAKTKLDGTQVDLDTMRAQANRFENRAKNLEKANALLESQVTERAEELKREQDKSLDRDVRQIVLDAIGAGIPPAQFEGHDAEPAEWLRANFASLEAFKGQVKAQTDTLRALGVKPKSQPARSGHDPAKAAEPPVSVELSDSERARLEAVGIDPEFVGVHDEKAARALAARKAPTNDAA